MGRLNRAPTQSVPLIGIGGDPCSVSDVILRLCAVGDEPIGGGGKRSSAGRRTDAGSQVADPCCPHRLSTHRTLHTEISILFMSVLLQRQPIPLLASLLDVADASQLDVPWAPSPLAASARPRFILGSRNSKLAMVSFLRDRGESRGRLTGPDCRCKRRSSSANSNPTSPNSRSSFTP